MGLSRPTTWLAGVPVAIAVMLAVTPNRASAQVFSTTDYSIFLGAVGGVTVEDFGPGLCFPIGSTLSSTSTYNCQTPIAPGDIAAGVTFSVSSGPLLIDGAAEFSGGFLDGLPAFGTVGPLHVSFDGAVMGFGFWTNAVYGGSQQLVDIFTTAGSFKTEINPIGNTAAFFGWYASSSLIQGATIQGVNSVNNSFSFALDDFTFGDVTSSTEVVPEPATMTLLATGLAGLAAARRKRKPQL